MYLWPVPLVYYLCSICRSDPVCDCQPRWWVGGCGFLHRGHLDPGGQQRTAHEHLEGPRGRDTPGGRLTLLIHIQLYFIADFFRYLCV